MQEQMFQIKYILIRLNTSSLFTSSNVLRAKRNVYLVKSLKVFLTSDLTEKSTESFDLDHS